MNIKRRFELKGIGISLPERCVSSAELEREIGMANGWVTNRMGVDQRYRVEGETNTSLGSSALRNALKDANLQISDIDYLIGASATFDHVLPNRSSLIKAEFPEAHELDFPCVDINTVCTSFVSAVDLASRLLLDEEYSNIAIVSSEIASKGLNPNDPKTYSLFGDAAGAIIISKTKEEKGAIQFLQKTYSESAKQTIIEGGGNRYHPKDFEYDSALHSFKMEGKSLLRSANKNIPKYFEEFFQGNDLTWDSIDCIIPHQASKNGLKILYQLPGIPQERIVNHLAEYGNCIAASIPVALYHALKDERLKKGQTCLIAGTAAGMSITGLLFKY